jgi:peptidoglycan/LPS O-acetylase OafA/YrhL
MPDRIGRLFDLRSGLWGAAIMSALVWLLNARHGLGPAGTAAAKQAAYTFLFGGLVMRLCGVLAERPVARFWRVAVVTVAAVFAVHSARGTPEPLLSTLPAALLGPPSFAAYAWRSVGR